MIGKTVANYEIITELGRGGMGEVYQARDIRLGRFVALKFLAERNLRDRTAVERFFREAQAASALNHPNIVTIYDIGEAGSGRFIAMELIRGRTLRSLAANGLPIEQLAEIGAQVARALGVAHAAGIVHRDIKPENIMIRDDRYVKVLDFGLARVAPASEADDDTETFAATDPGTLLGTVRYMAPEQGRGETVTAAADVFSLGIVFYELATGRHPFPADSQIGILHAILSQTPMPPSRLKPGIPAVLEALILQMLEKDPRLRPSAADVEAALSGATGVAASPKPQDVVVRAQRRVVGRKQQLADLHSAFDRAAGGRAFMVCLAGEPGIGKTTLAEDFFIDLAARGTDANIARGRCSERLAGSEAYLPFLEALESLLHGPAGDSAARAMKLVAPTWYVQIAPLSAEDSSFARVMGEAKAASQERMKRELIAFLQEVSRARPLILFFDDLHWADVSTVDLLSYIGSKCSARLLLVGTYRPSELLAAKHPFLQVKLELQGHGLCREIALDFLGREDVDTYLALEFPENRFPPELSALVHAKTEGNPLFMADLIRYLRDRGVIAEEQGRWTLVKLVPDIERELPESVRSMIQRKIDQLSAPDRKLLVAASVQGHEFDSAVLAKALSIDPAEVEERLEALDRIHAFVRLVSEREFPDSTLTLRYCFVHVLYQDALYATVTATRKAAMSAAVAQALESCFGDQNSQIAAELALLFEAARDFGRASDYFVFAAKNTFAVCANQETIALLHRALANAEKLRGAARHTRVHKASAQLARVYETMTRFADAVEAYTVAEKAAREADDVDSQIQAICGKANALFLAKKMEECREHIRTAFELAQRQQSREALAGVEVLHATERLCAGDFETALECYERAVPILRETGLSPGSLLGANFRGYLHAWRLEHEDAQRIFGWTLERAAEVGDRLRILQNYFGRAITFGHQGQLGQALHLLHEARRIAELNGERFVLARVPNTLGWVHRELLDLEGALDLDLEGARLSQEVGDNEAEINSRINAGQVLLLLGEPERAFEHLERADVLLSRFNWFTWVFKTRLEAELASYWIARGDLKRAASHASASLEITERALTRKHTALAQKLLGDIAALEDRADDAQQHYESALRAIERHPCPPVEWRVRKASADLARRLGQSSLADEQTARARAVIDSLAGSVHDETLRQKLLASQAVREL